MIEIWFFLPAKRLELDFSDDMRSILFFINFFFLLIILISHSHSCEQNHHCWNCHLNWKLSLLSFKTQTIDVHENLKNHCHQSIQPLLNSLQSATPKLLNHYHAQLFKSNHRNDINPKSSKSHPNCNSQYITIHLHFSVVKIWNQPILRLPNLWHQQLQTINGSSTHKGCQLPWTNS